MKNRSLFFKIVLLFVCTSVAMSEAECSYNQKKFNTVWAFEGTTSQELLIQFEAFPKNKKPTKILTTKISVEKIVEYLQQKNLCHSILETSLEDSTGFTFLHAACRNGDLALVKYLIEKGATIKTRDKADHTPLHYACLYNHAELVEYLIEQGANIHNEMSTRENHNRGRTLLYWACQGHCTEVAKVLIKHGANINAVKGGRSLVRQAFKNRCTGIIKYLIEIGVDISLHAAVESGNQEIVLLLLKNGANINAWDNEHKTPLHYTDCNGTMIMVLIKNGADINAINGSGQTPLHSNCRQSSHSGSDAIAALLIKNGARINDQDNLGNTPLHYACNASRIKTVELLLAHGADSAISNNSGQTPVDIAHKNRSAKRLMQLFDKSKMTMSESMQTFRKILQNTIAPRIRTVRSTMQKISQSLVAWSKKRLN